MRNTVAAIALSDAEIADFFPDHMWGELQQLLPSAQRLHTPIEEPSRWARFLRDTHPEVIVTCWQTPSFNSEVRAEDLNGLRYICHLAGTVRKLVPRELIHNGITVTNWGNVIGPTVAECTLMLILMALRRASYWAIAMHRDQLWKNGSTVTQSLIGRRVGIHGFGGIAQALVPMLRPFTNSISSYSPHVPDTLFRLHDVRRVESLEELFSNSDVVVELAAATPQNRGLVTEKLLRSIPEGGVFVNVGRGSVVDEEALARVAGEGRLLVALDVYDREPLPVDSPFRGMPNVTLLPHLGGPTRDRRRDSGALALRNLRAYLKGEPLEAVVTLDIYDRST
jgi:phosphoglycerate dehydrogenase-like enzyme